MALPLSKDFFCGFPNLKAQLEEVENMLIWLKVLQSMTHMVMYGIVLHLSPSLDTRSVLYIVHTFIYIK